MQYRKKLGTCVALTSAMLLYPACQNTTTDEVGVRDGDVPTTEHQQRMAPPREGPSTPSFVPTELAPLHTRIASTRWAERKLAQRSLIQLRGEQRTSSALEFATEAMRADAKRAQRLLLAALSLDAKATVAAVVANLADSPSVTRDAALRVLLAEDLVELQPQADALLGIATSMVERPTTPVSYGLGLAIFAKLGDPSATSRISAAIHASDKPTRKAGMSVLQRWAVPGGLELALSALQDPEVYMRRRAAAALALYPSSPDALAAVTQLLQTETDTRVCTRGLEALASFPPQSVEPLLVEKLGATEHCGLEQIFVTLAVARRVVRKSAVDLPVLRGALTTLASGPPQFGIKAAAVIALGDLERARQLEGADAVDALGELVSKSLESPEVRAGAVAALGDLRSQEATSRLYRVLEDVELSQQMVVATLEAIDKSALADTERMVALLPFTARGEATNVRALAISHIARNAIDPRSAARLVVLRDDGDPAIAGVAGQGVRRIFGDGDISTPSALTVQLERVALAHHERRAALERQAQVLLADAHRHDAAEEMSEAGGDAPGLVPPASLVEASANPTPPTGEVPTPHALGQLDL